MAEKRNSRNKSLKPKGKAAPAARKAANRPSASRLSDEALSTLFAPRALPEPVRKVLASKAPAKRPAAVKAAKPTVKIETPVTKPKAPTPKAEAPKPQPKAAPQAAATKPTEKVAEKPTEKIDPVAWSQTMAELAEKSQQRMLEFMANQKSQPATGSVMQNEMFNSFFDLTARMLADPVKLMHSQLALWDQYLLLWKQTTMRFLGSDEQASAVAAPAPGDKRFKDPAWSENPVFDYIKQSYLLTSRWMQGQVHEAEGIDQPGKKKLDFYTRQFVDALSPTNFFLTNPQVLRSTLESGGENLLKGLDNLLEDIQKGRLTMTDEKAFEVGKNLAISPGAVVFRNELLELIQYSPSTPNVARRPLLIVPPWINKFYILDLKPENSFIKWAVDQGLTVFCVSWVNPDASLAKKDFADYMTSGIFAAMDAVEAATGEKDLNVIGYCIGGTLLASSLAYMEKAEPARTKRIHSATFFTTMLDFAEPGDLGVFIDEEQLQSIEAEMSEKGYLEAREMGTAFNLMRANDLIWSFVVNNYLLGKQPFPFDLLYWNGDSTRMPAAMHKFYLRNMYQKNLLCKPNGVSLKGQGIDLHNVKTPSYFISTREDHIAPWASTYAATQMFKGPMTFVLAGSGHIAGVVNPPAAKKYQHWLNDKLPTKPDDWLASATQHEGSWWPHWRDWLEQYTDGQVPARTKLGGEKLKPLCPAPGEYVKVKAS